MSQPDPKVQLIERITALVLGSKDPSVESAAEAIASAWIEDVAKAEKAMAERCWAEVHPAERGWHRVGDIYDKAVADLAALTNKSKDK